MSQPNNGPLPWQQEEEADGLIIVMEDDEDTALLLREVIESGTPYQALCLQRPDEILHRLEDLAALKPALLLLDVALPASSSIECYDRWHAQRGLASVPALFLSAVKGDRPFEQALAARQVGVVKKPFDLDELYQVIDQLTEPGRRSGEDGFTERSHQ